MSNNNIIVHVLCFFYYCVHNKFTIYNITALNITQQLNFKPFHDKKYIYIYYMISQYLIYYQLLNRQVLSPEIPTEKCWVDDVDHADSDHCPRLHW